MIYPVNNRLKNYSGSYGYDKANRLISLDIIRVVGANAGKWGHLRGICSRLSARDGW
jgi:hypothetical protein